MNYLNGYVPKLPDGETVAQLSKEIAQNTITEIFKDSMPQIHDTINKVIGAMSQNNRESNPDIAEELDKLVIDNSAAVNIFTNYILPEYESIINNTEDEMEVNLVESDGGSDNERDQELVPGKQGIN